MVAAQQEIAAAEKENAEKEAAAQAVLDEQEKMMNSIVEESRKLQKEAEENLKVLYASLVIWVLNFDNFICVFPCFVKHAAPIYNRY